VAVARGDRVHDAAVRVLALGAVRLVDDDEHDARRVQHALLQVVEDGLGRAVEDAPLDPELAPRLHVRIPVDLRRLVLGEADAPVARAHLLGDQGPRRRHEDDLAVGEPAAVVVHCDRRDHRLP